VGGVGVSACGDRHVNAGMTVLALKGLFPKKATMATRAAPLNVESPKGYSENAGMTTLSAWDGIQFWPRTFPWSAMTWGLAAVTARSRR